MLSRTANHLFWMARYAERAGLARSACGAARTPLCATAHGGVFGLLEYCHAV
jgi:A predicted alpha-helical domain with a conserved ER motif.